MADARPFRFRCPGCGTRNNIPPDKVGKTGRCGKCGNALHTSVLRIGEPAMVTDTNFEEMVLKSPLPTVLFFWAPWCPSCTAMVPQMETVAQDTRGRIRVAKINVDANPVLAERYDIRSVPYMMIFDGGRLKESIPGGLPRHELLMRMARYL